MKGEKIMGSTGAGRGAAGGGATATGSRPIQMGGINMRSRRAQQRFIRNANAAGQTGRVSDEDFIRATGVNPRTGRRVRRGR